MREGWRGLCGVLLLAFGLLAGTGLVPARAQAGAPADAVTLGDADSYPLSKAFSVLHDEDGRLTLDDILAPAQQARFEPVRQDGAPGANFGLTRAAIWLRVHLDVPPGADPHWLLELAYPPMDRIELYTPAAGGGHDRQVGGDLLPFTDRAVPHRNHVMPVQLVPGAQATLYLRLTSDGTVAAPVTLWKPAALWKHDLGSYAGLSLYFGLLIGLLLYNLLLYVSVRDVGYLIYVGFVAAMGVSQAALSGLGAQFLWPQAAWWNNVSPAVGMTTAAILGLQFARNFLASALRQPWLDRWLLLPQMAGWGLSLLAALVLPYRVSAIMVTVLAVTSVATLVTAGVLGVRQGGAGARYFLTAWAVLLLGVLTLTLHNTGVVPSNPLTANGLLIGSALEMVLLSFALADRINVAQRFKEQAQARIEAEHSMVEVLWKSQERLKNLLEEREIILESSLVGIVFLTYEGRFRWANRAMLDIFQAHEQSFDSMEPFYLTREQYLEVGGEVHQAVLRGEVYQKELQMRRCDGALIWIALSGKAVKSGQLDQGTVWVLMDITQRKELEEQLKKSMSEREAILNNAVVGIVLSVRRRHEWVSEKFAQMMGYPRQILIGQPSSYIHPDLDSWERFGREARATLIETGSYTCERQLKRRNGELFWVQMGGSCIVPNDPDSGVIWTFLDITDRKRSEAEIQEALEQQRALNELRSRFVAMTSHEFRTPLAAILSSGELLRHYGDRLPPQERIEVLDGIGASVQRMSRLMDRVLLLGQADAQMLEFVPQELDLVPLCRRFVDEARAQHPDSQCQVVTEFDPALRRGLYDEKLLGHIFGNLLSNALKYSPQGGQVLLRVAAEEGATRFEVADQGIGIPAEELPHLFGSFHRASNVGKIQGTGLGLAIVRNAVHMHGGTISVSSTQGAGTRFTVRLPAAGPAHPS